MLETDTLYFHSCCLQFFSGLIKDAVDSIFYSLITLGQTVPEKPSRLKLPSSALFLSAPRNEKESGTFFVVVVVS